MPVFQHKVPVVRPHLPSLEQYTRGLQAIWERAWLTNSGPELTGFRADIEALFETPNVALFSSGALALEAVLEVMELEGEVILPAFSFPATANAVIRAGLTPVFADIEADRLTVDPAEVDRLCGPRTAAIMGVHMFGMPCFLEELAEISSRRGIPLVYDAAHTFGVRYKGRSIGAYGDMSMFSLHSTKAIHSVEGGAVTFGRDELRAKLESFANHGIGGDARRSSNAKMSELHALMGRIVMSELPQIRARLGRLRAFYDAGITGIPGILPVYKSLDGLEGHSGFYPILVEPDAGALNRDALMADLAAENIETRAYFHPPLNEDPRYGASPGGTPVAKDISSRILAIPFFADLPENDASKIIEVLDAIVRRHL